MTPEYAREQLLSQHDRIRGHLAICVGIAKLFRMRNVGSLELDAALTALREDLAAHNSAEAAIVTRLLDGPAPWSKQMIDRMLEEHIAEHVAFWDMLTGTRAEVARRMDELAEVLEAHMAAEERTFLAPATLRDDVIRSRTRTE